MKQVAITGPVHPRLMQAIPADIEAIINGFSRDLFAQDSSENQNLQVEADQAE